MLKYKSVFRIFAVFVIFAAFSNCAMAYNYAGYKWGGSWPVVTVNYSQVYVTAWRNIITTAENNWNGAGARFTFQNGSSNNNITVTYQNNSTLATTTIYRQWWGGGNVSRCTVAINSYQTFNPPYNGYNLATVMRHEFGHWLVLNHTGYGLMQPSLGVGQIFQIGTDDRNGIRFIYGAS